MPKVNNVAYPSDVKRILARSDIGEPYRRFAEENGCKLEMKFVAEVFFAQSPKHDYEDFFSPKSKLSLPKHVKKQAEYFGEAEDWTAREWRAIYQVAYNHVCKTLQSKLNKKFFTPENLGRYETVRKKAKRSIKGKMLNAFMEKTGMTNSTDAQEAMMMLQFGDKKEAMKKAGKGLKNKAKKEAFAMFRKAKSNFWSSMR